jgi:hypothetical protein
MSDRKKSRRLRETDSLISLAFDVQVSIIKAAYQ